MLRGVTNDKLKGPSQVPALLCYSVVRFAVRLVGFSHIHGSSGFQRNDVANINRYLQCLSEMGRAPLPK